LHRIGWRVARSFLGFAHVCQNPSSGEGFRLRLLTEVPQIPVCKTCESVYSGAITSMLFPLGSCCLRRGPKGLMAFG
jgi:hypothetical protein